MNCPMAFTIESSIGQPAPISLKRFNLDFSERNPASMDLQSDKAWFAWRARFSPSGVGIEVLGNFHAIQEDSVILSLGVNLELIPLANRFYRKIAGSEELCKLQVRDFKDGTAS